jgi:hypothetical protein
VDTNAILRYLGL